MITGLKMAWNPLKARKPTSNLVNHDSSGK
jgi:hypothetical protein